MKFMSSARSPRCVLVAAVLTLTTTACFFTGDEIDSTVDSSVNQKSDKDSTGRTALNGGPISEGEKSQKLVLYRKTIVDPGMRNMTSHTMYVPEGWTLKGETKWAHPSLFRLLPSPQIKISSPDGFEANFHTKALFSDPRPSVEYMRNYGIQRPREWSSDGGYPVHYRPDSLQQWAEYFKVTVIPQRHPKARDIKVTRVFEVPQFTQILQQRSESLRRQIEATNRQSRGYGLGESQSFNVQGLVVESTFVDNGMRKEFIALLGFHNMSTRLQGLEQVRWSVEPNLSYVGPEGKLEASLPKLFAISGSVRPTQQWQNQLRKHLAAMNRPVPTRSGAGTSVGNTFSEILDSSHASFMKRQNMQDPGQRRIVNTIHETEDYSYGGQSYKLSAGYNHAYTDNFDTIILTNDSLFQPGVDWSPMQMNR